MIDFQEIFGRILSMLFLWFHSTVRLPGNEIGSILGKLKSEVNQTKKNVYGVSIVVLISMSFHG